MARSWLCQRWPRKVGDSPAGRARYTPRSFTGYADVLIEVRSPGGHSSVPPAHTSVGLLSRLIVALEDADVYSPVLTKQSPIYQYLECVAAQGDADKIPGWLPPALERGDMDDLAHGYADRSLSQRYMIQTSKAATVFHGGVKSNALPEEAQAVINSRIQVSTICLPQTEHFRSGRPLTSTWMSYSA
jgi:Gly-Xaa carboxypeptidase